MMDMGVSNCKSRILLASKYRRQRSDGICRGSHINNTKQNFLQREESTLKVKVTENNASKQGIHSVFQGFVVIGYCNVEWILKMP